MKEKTDANIENHTSKMEKELCLPWLFIKKRFARPLVQALRVEKLIKKWERRDSFSDA